MSIAESTACSASSEYGGRRSRKGSRCGASAWGCGWCAIENSTGELDIFPGRALPTGIAKERCGVVGDDQRHPVIPVHLSTQFTDRQLGVEECLRGKRAERENDLGLDQLDLSKEIRAARDNLFGPRIPVARRPMLENVADEDVFALQIDGAEYFCEQLPRRADERAAGFIFGRAGRFADAHEVGVRIALPRDRIGRRGIER